MEDLSKSQKPVRGMIFLRTKKIIMPHQMTQHNYYDGNA
jgi:hypothetical protein